MDGAGLAGMPRAGLAGITLQVDRSRDWLYNACIVNNKERRMKSWIRDGEHVKARYMGVPVSGRVERSRVKYGGRVQYTVLLDTPLQLPWRNEHKIQVLIDSEELVV